LMKLKLFGAVLITAVSLSAPAFAADPSDVVVVTAAPDTTAPTTGAPTPAATDADNQIICRNIPPPLRTRIGGRRECATRHAWEAQEPLARDMVHDAKNKPWINPGSGKDNLPPMGGH